MTVFTFGSINVDHIYHVPHLPAPGETLAASGYSTGLGGKGANQSVAAARAGARVVHLGAVGADGAGLRDRLGAMGVDCTNVQVLDHVATGHAVIMLAPDGENSIVLYDGANRAMAAAPARAALGAAAELGDILLMQNETAHQADLAQHATGLGMEVIYSAAPFDVDAVRAVLPFVTVLVLNAVEADQLRAALRVELAELPVESLIVTRGPEGADWISQGVAPLRVPAFSVTAVDTTGAGDCFSGTVAAMLDAGHAPPEAMRLAAAAAAVQVTRPGAAEAMPTAAEVQAFLASRK